MIKSLPKRYIAAQESIAYWEDFLSDEDINLLLRQPEWSATQLGRVGGFDGEIDIAARAATVCWIGSKPELSVVWDKLGRTVAEVNQRFFKFDLDGFYEPLQLSTYSESFNGHYDWHVDAISNDEIPRKLSMALMLSDPSDFEGGNLEVKLDSDRTIVLEQKKGRAWFFPSYTLHRVSPVTKGERKSAVLWIGGPPFR